MIPSVLKKKAYEWWPYGDGSYLLAVYNARKANKINRALGLPYGEVTIKDGEEPLFSITDAKQLEFLARTYLDYGG